MTLLQRAKVTTPAAPPAPGVPGAPQRPSAAEKPRAPQAPPAAAAARPPAATRPLPAPAPQQAARPPQAPQQAPPARAGDDGRPDLASAIAGITSIKDLDSLLERVLDEARRFVNADAGTIYMLAGNYLYFSFVQNDTLFRGETKDKYSSRDAPAHGQEVPRRLRGEDRRAAS